jgi:hypothetical protein
MSPRVGPCSQRRRRVNAKRVIATVSKNTTWMLAVESLLTDPEGRSDDVPEL